MCIVVVFLHTERQALLIFYYEEYAGSIATTAIHDVYEYVLQIFTVQMSPLHIKMYYILNRYININTELDRS